MKEESKKEGKEGRAEGSGGSLTVYVQNLEGGPKVAENLGKHAAHVGLRRAGWEVGDGGGWRAEGWGRWEAGGGARGWEVGGGVWAGGGENNAVTHTHRNTRTPRADAWGQAPSGSTLCLCCSPALP